MADTKDLIIDEAAMAAACQKLAEQETDPEYPELPTLPPLPKTGEETVAIFIKKTPAGK